MKYGKDREVRIVNTGRCTVVDNEKHINIEDDKYRKIEDTNKDR